MRDIKQETSIITSNSLAISFSYMAISFSYMAISFSYMYKSYRHRKNGIFIRNINKKY